MPTPTSAKSTIDTSHWTAGLPIREYYLQVEVLQNMQYALDNLAASALNNASQFWAARAQQAGRGGPIP